MSRKDSLRKIISTHQRRLQKLKEQKASFGLHTPPHILTEIEDIEKKLERLHTELATSNDDKGNDLPELVTDGTPPEQSGRGHIFNLQEADIKAGVFNQGGVQHISGPIEVDMSEAIIQVGSGGSYIAGDQFSGDFRKAMVNVKSQLDNVIQGIDALPNVKPDEKETLLRLVNELKAQLAQVPAEKVKETEMVSKRMETLIKEVNEEEPDKEMIEITAESLRRAANNLAKIVPAVLPIATQIVAHAVKFVG